MMDPSFDPRQLTEEGVLLSQILRAYLLLYCKTIDLVYTELSKGNIIEGEDCWLDHYGLPIKVNDDVEAIVEFANEALAWLENVKADCMSYPKPSVADHSSARCFWRSTDKPIGFSESE